VSGHSSPTRYEVIISQWVRQRLLEFADVAKARGDAAQFLDSLKAFQRRLELYPQFGDPIIDLKAHVGQIRVGIIPPLAMRYGVLEEQRKVVVTAGPVLLPKQI
jgi:hypothetical protein